MAPAQQTNQDELAGPRPALLPSSSWLLRTMAPKGLDVVSEMLIEVPSVPWPPHSWGGPPPYPQKSLCHNLSPSNLAPGPHPLSWPTTRQRPSSLNLLPVPSHPATGPPGPQTHLSTGPSPTLPSPSWLAFVAASCCALGGAGWTGTGQPCKARVQLSECFR